MLSPLQAAYGLLGSDAHQLKAGFTGRWRAVVDKKLADPRPGVTMVIEPAGSEPMSRVRTEIQIDQELLRWVDDQASRSGRSRDEVLEEAVRRGRQVGPSLVEIASDVWERSDLTGQQAMELARSEVEAVRAERSLPDRAHSA